MPRAGLDTAAVVAEAIRLADEEGPEALSLAALARRLGVKTPSLYNHIDGLPGLRRAVARFGLDALADTLSAAAVGRAGRDALFFVAHAYRDFARVHPGLYALTQRSYEANAGDPDPELAAAGQAAVQVVLAVLRGYGLEGDDALHAARALRSALHGFVALETGGGFGLALALDESFARLLGLLDAGLIELGKQAGA